MLGMGFDSKLMQADAEQGNVRGNKGNVGVVDIGRAARALTDPQSLVQIASAHSPQDDWLCSQQHTRVPCIAQVCHSVFTLSVWRHFGMCDMRCAGVMLIDRNDELAALHEKAHTQEALIAAGTMELSIREDEVRLPDRPAG